MLDHTAPQSSPTSNASQQGFIEDVLPTLLAWRRENIASALVTVVGVDGSSPRPVGSQMAVSIDGRYVGQISSGCAELAIVEEAISCLKNGKNRVIRYGKGSPYLDIVLPCGSGIDIFFDSQIPTTTIANLTTSLEARQPATLEFDLKQLSCQTSDSVGGGPDQDHRALANMTWSEGDTVYKRYAPQIRLLTMGRGHIVGAMAQLGQYLGYETHVFAPDIEILNDTAKAGAKTTKHLTTPSEKLTELEDLSDPWTAAVLMFHDHEWEPALLKKLLATECFFIGAIGSKRTHAQRLEALEDMGCTPQHLSRIKGPVGLDIGAKNPLEIALSISAEILQNIRQN
ncbi:MAG: XdhC family protein [Hyphomicrobiaceae bacterium]